MDGWLWLYYGTNYLKVFFKEMKMDWMTNPTISHFAGEGHLKYNMKKQWYVWKVKNIILPTYLKFTNFMTYIKTWMDDYAYLTMKTQRDAAGDFIAWNGTTETWTVSIPKDGLKEVEKISAGESQIYEIGMLILEMSG